MQAVLLYLCKLYHYTLVSKVVLFGLIYAVSCVYVYSERM